MQIRCAVRKRARPGYPDCVPSSSPLGGWLGVGCSGVDCEIVNERPKMSGYSNLREGGEAGGCQPASIEIQG